MKSEKLKNRSTSLAIIGGLIIAVSLSGCGSIISKGASNTTATSTITATPSYTIGTPIDVTDGRGNAAKVTILSAKFTTEKPSKYAPAPKTGQYLVLEVQWDETSGKMMAGSSYINARDDNGNMAQHAILVDNAFPMGYVVAGDKSKGTVAFDVKQGPVSIIFNDMTITGEYARVKLNP